MKTFLLSCLSALGAVTLLCSCGSMQPDEKLQKVVSGDVFGGQPVDMRHEKQLEDAVREEHMNMPSKHSADKETDDGGGKVGFRMPL